MVPGRSFSWNEITEKERNEEVVPRSQAVLPSIKTFSRRKKSLVAREKTARAEKGTSVECSGGWRKM